MGWGWKGLGVLLLLKTYQLKVAGEVEESGGVSRSNLLASELNFSRVEHKEHKDFCERGIESWAGIWYNMRRLVLEGLK